MTESKRLLLVIQELRDYSRIIVEFHDQAYMERFRKEAEGHGMKCEQIGVDQYCRTTYRGCRYFDLRNAFTRKSFELEDWVHFLDHWDEHERDDEFGIEKL